MVGADDNGHDAAFAEYRKCVRSEVSQGLKYVNNTKQEATARKFPKVLISHAGSRRGDASTETRAYSQLLYST
jgi:hypothetical protein